VFRAGTQQQLLPHPPTSHASWCILCGKWFGWSVPRATLCAVSRTKNCREDVPTRAGSVRPPALGGVVSDPAFRKRGRQAAGAREAPTSRLAG